MEYATGDAQKGPVLLESPLKGMISSSKLQVVQSDMRKKPGKKSQQCQHLQRPSDSPEHHDSIALQLPTFTTMKSVVETTNLFCRVDLGSFIFCGRCKKKNVLETKLR